MSLSQFLIPLCRSKVALAAGLFKREYRDHRLEWMIKSGGLEVVQAGLEHDNIRFTGVFARDVWLTYRNALQIS